MNKIVIIGRLTKDPELRSTSNGVAVANFTVAVDRPYKNAKGEKETDFIPVITWRGLAESCSKFLAKGKQVAVEGRLQIRTYEDEKGNKRTIAEIMANEVQFLTPSNNSGSSNNYSEPQYPGEEMTPLDDIPF